VTSSCRVGGESEKVLMFGCQNGQKGKGTNVGWWDALSIVQVGVEAMAGPAISC